MQTRAVAIGAALNERAAGGTVAVSWLSTLQPAASTCQHFSIFSLLLCGGLGVRRTGRVECVRLFWREDGGEWRVQLFARSARSGLV